jgi:hypothetical protein
MATPKSMLTYRMNYPYKIVLPEKYELLKNALQNEVKLLLSTDFPDFNQEDFVIIYSGSPQKCSDLLREYTEIIYQVPENVAPKLFEAFDYIRDHLSFSPETPVLQNILVCDPSKKINIINVYTHTA